MYQLYNNPEIICFVSIQTCAKCVFDVNFNKVWEYVVCVCMYACFKNISKKNMNTLKDLLPSIVPLGSCWEWIRGNIFPISIISHTPCLQAFSGLFLRCWVFAFWIMQTLAVSLWKSISPKYFAMLLFSSWFCYHFFHWRING